MKWNWRRAAREAITRNDHRSILAGAVAGVGGAIAIGVMEWFSVAAHYPLAAIPFATSIVLVIGSPEAEPAQPRAGRRPLRQRPGRLCGAQIDRPASLGGGRRPIHSPMYVTGTFHPQGINPLLVVSGNLPGVCCAGADRRGAVDRVCLALAPLGSRPKWRSAGCDRRRD
jgi:hypothetical protein